MLIIPMSRRIENAAQSMVGLIQAVRGLASVLAEWAGQDKDRAPALNDACALLRDAFELLLDARRLLTGEMKTATAPTAALRALLVELNNLLAETRSLPDLPQSVADAMAAGERAIGLEFLPGRTPGAATSTVSLTVPPVERIYRCACGATFPDSLGKYGCPSCHGEGGPARQEGP